MTRPRKTSGHPLQRLAGALALCASLLLSAPGPAAAADLTVFAAASLKTALDRVKQAWEAETGLDLAISYAGSSTLAQQIVQGAPVDLFISANPGWMDHVAASGRTLTGTRRDLLGNRLVLIVPTPETPVTPEPDDTPDATTAEVILEVTGQLDLPALLGGGKLAMALVDAVPAGLYGKASLMSLGLWETALPSVAQTDNARAALALVATGAAAAGVVYATDAWAEPRVKVQAVFSDKSHPPIVYPVAVLRSPRETLALDLLAFLASAPARQIFQDTGFAVIE